MTINNAKAKLVVTIVGIGYVGLSNAVLLAQHNKVYAVDIQPERVNAVNNRCSPIMDKEIEEYFAVKDMDLTAVMDGIQAYRDADFIIISTPTNYDPVKNYFDTSSVESVIEEVLKINREATIIIKSTVPVGFTESVRKNTTPATSFSAPNSCGKAMPSTIISTPPVSSSEPRRMTRKWCRKPTSSSPFWKKAPSKKTSPPWSSIPRKPRQ